MKRKGSGLEELVRAYFARQGFFALRGTSYRYEDEQVTDVDVWVYARQSASIRTRTIVDVKNKRSPKAFERILWARGMQLALGCDRAVVATTERSPKVIAFARQQKVALLTKDFLDRLQQKLDTSRRMTLEEFIENLRQYPDHKRDGDWVTRISDAKSALLSLHGYRAFNKALAAFRFFGERVEVRPHHREQALRGVYLTAALACVALDSALEGVVYDDQKSRYRAIMNGVTYGDADDAGTQKSIKRVLDIVSQGMESGRVIARQVEAALGGMFGSIRADILAEHFVQEHNASILIKVARELDERAHTLDLANADALSTESRSVLGVYADFAQIKRTALLSDSAPATSRPADVRDTQPPPPQTGDSEQPPDSSQAALFPNRGAK